MQKHDFLKNDKI